MFIDMTRDLAPILLGLNVALVVSALAIFGSPAVNTWLRSLRNVERPRLVLHRPALAR